MTDTSAFGVAVGFIAGGILLFSGLPALVEILRDKIRKATPGERRSRLLMALGNGLWVVSGLMTENTAVVVMCGINTIIQAAIWCRMACGPDPPKSAAPH
jgi:uncharacterized protein with PQ loop repeat